MSGQIARRLPPYFAQVVDNNSDIVVPQTFKLYPHTVDNQVANLRARDFRKMGIMNGKSGFYDLTGNRVISHIDL
jgi:hypothetical protein